MKDQLKSILFIGAALISLHLHAQKKSSFALSDDEKSRHMFIDVHHLGNGEVTAKAVAEAHKKDLAVQHRYGVSFLKYWLDEAHGDIYCLSLAPDSQSIKQTHAEAHGLLPNQFYEVKEGKEEMFAGENDLYLDIHELGAGKVTVAAVEDAHQKDLAVQKKHGVHLINYWVDEKKGTIMCLAQAPNADSLINTHKEAHGLLPDKVQKVNQQQ